MLTLNSLNELIAFDLGSQAIALRIAQFQASEDREKIATLQARVEALTAPGEGEKAGQRTVDAAALRTQA